EPALARYKDIKRPKGSVSRDRNKLGRVRGFGHAMKRLILSIAAAAALAACETVPPPPPPPTETPPPARFRAEDFAWSARPGTGGVEGLLGYRHAGRAYTCAGQPVILIPDAPFSRRRMALLYGSPDRAELPTDVIRSRQVGLP